MTFIDVFNSLLGWCPRFNGSMSSSIEEQYRGSYLIFGISTIAVVTLLGFYTIVIRSLPMPRERNTEVFMAVVMMAAIIAGNIATVQWRISRKGIPRSEWELMKRVILRSFAFVAAASIATGFLIPESSAGLANPLLYFSYLAFNQFYAKRQLQDASDVADGLLWWRK